MKASTLVTAFKHRRQIKELVRCYLMAHKHGDQNFWGSISEEDATSIVANTQKAAALSGPIVEIGALFGLTTQLIATHKPLAKSLIAVEALLWNPFVLPPADHKVFTDRVLQYCTKNCNTKVFYGTNTEFYHTYSGTTPSMVFIDADHTYEGVKVDIDWAKRTGVPLISGHDYNPLHPGVIRAVDEAFGGAHSVVGSVWTVLSN